MFHGETSISSASHQAQETVMTMALCPEHLTAYYQQTEPLLWSVTNSEMINRACDRDRWIEEKE